MDLTDVHEDRGIDVPDLDDVLRRIWRFHESVIAVL